MITEKESLMNCDIETGLCELTQPFNELKDVRHSKAVNFYTLPIRFVLPVGA
jgi:hypothetical protein